MPFGTFFQKEHLSIALQIIILNILKNDSTHMSALRHPILGVREVQDFTSPLSYSLSTSLFKHYVES